MSTPHDTDRRDANTGATAARPTGDRDDGGNNWWKWLVALIIAIVIAIALFFALGGDADVDVEPGEAPEVDIDPGEAPDVESDIEAPDVDVESPDVDIDVDPGDIEVDEATADANAENDGD